MLNVKEIEALIIERINTFAGDSDKATFPFMGFTFTSNVDNKDPITLTDDNGNKFLCGNIPDAANVVYLSQENPLLSAYQSSRMNYCHDVEVFSLEELREVIEALVDSATSEGFNETTIMNFVSTLMVHPIDLEEEEEEDIHSFDLEAYVKSLL